MLFKKPYTGKISQQFEKVAHVGSRETCNPPPTDTDDDYLCLLRNYHSMDHISEILLADGWSLSIKKTNTGDLVLKQKNEYNDIGDAGAEFRSFRKGDINLIVTSNEKFYDSFVLAARVCKNLNLMNKDQRIMVHRAIMKGEWVPEYSKA